MFGRRTRIHTQDRSIRLPETYTVSFPHGETAGTFPNYQEAIRFQSYVSRRFLIPTTVKRGK